MPNLEFTKNYIKEQIQQKGFDDNNQICINFSDICTEEETQQASKELGFLASQGEGEGVWWLVKEN